MKNELSAFIDGELDPDASARLLQRLRQDDMLRQAWHDYHLIGDALRGHIGPSLDARFAQRLEAESTVLAPVPIVAIKSSRGMQAFAAAAGIAAVAVAAWVALPQFGGEGGGVPGVTIANSTAPPASQVAEVPLAVGVDDYLLAHQRFSPASSMQSVAPYVRSVSGQRAGGRQ